MRGTRPTKSQKAGHDREGLLASLGRLKPALRADGAILELSHVWLADGHACAYDGGLGVRLALDLDFECGVPGRALAGLLGTSSVDRVELQLTDKDTVLTVKMGRSRTKLNVLDPSRCPWPFPTEHEATVQLSEAAVDALRAVLVSRTSSPARLEHHGVFVFADGDVVDVYATDSRTIAVTTFVNDGGLPKFTFLPRPLVEQVVTLCPQGADLTVAEDHFAVVGRGAEVCSNILDTTGIQDIPAVVEKNLSAHPEAVVLPAGLEETLDRAEVLSGPAADPVVDIVIDGTTFSLSGKMTYGELKEDLTLEEDHPAVELSVDASLLRRGLQASDAFSATGDSLAFYGAEDFVYLVAAVG